MIEWHEPATAPRNGKQILAQFGPGNVHIAAWNEPTAEWCIGLLCVDLHKGSWNHVYFENNYIVDYDLTAWAEIS